MDPRSDRVTIDWPCSKCGGNLRGRHRGDLCPACATPVPPKAVRPDAIAPGLVIGEQACLVCGYDLRGISNEGACPECATPVANSLRGDLLKYSSAEYVALLHRGVYLIQAAIVGQLLVVLGFWIVDSIAAATVGSGAVRLRLATWGSPLQTGLLTILGITSIVGWWLFSARDPALGERDEGATARVIVRATVVIQAAATVVSMAASPHGAPGPSGVLDILGGLLWIASLIAMVIWWFAAMRYIRRLAPRIPSDRILRRAKLLTWLFPVLLFVVCAGWLADLILYYNLLEWLRKDLKAIRAAQALTA